MNHYSNMTMCFQLHLQDILSLFVKRTVSSPLTHLMTLNNF